MTYSSTSHTHDAIVLRFILKILGISTLLLFLDVSLSLTATAQGLPSESGMKVIPSYHNDVSPPLSGQSGVEDRISNTYTAVFTFNAAVTSGSVTVQSGTATAGTPSFSGNEMRVPLTGVADVQVVTLHVSNVNGSGTTAGDVPFGFLESDVDGNRTVERADQQQIKTDKNQMVNATNFRDDLNLSGNVDRPDLQAVKPNAGHSLP